MTSIPSPFDALRALLPLPGRGGEGGPFAGLGDGPELDHGPPRGLGPHGRHGDGHTPQMPGPLRADGLPPLSLPEATQVADMLSAAMRQNPSHPLFRELPQVPTEVFRQWVVDFLTVPAGLARDVPGQAVAPLAQAAAAAAALLRDAGPPPAVTEAHAQADALRATMQAQAQQAAADRAQAMPRAGDEARAMAATATPEGRMPTDARTAGVAQVPAQTIAQPQRAEAALPAFANAIGLSATAPLQTAAAPSPPGHTAASSESARTLQDPSAPWLQARTPVEASLPARAERTGATADPAPSGGLPGLAGAAGVTLAAVGQPAGTTFAQAPQEAVRARKSDEARRARDGRAAEARQREQDGEGHPHERGHEQGDATTKRKAAGAAAAGEDRASAALRASDAAGHTALAGLLLPGEDDLEDEVRPAGHVGAGEVDEEADAEARQSRRRQWLYWSLIAVTYGCLALALGMMTPWGASLPVAPESLPFWRNTLTTAGLATGLWAWLLARRMR